MPPRHAKGPRNVIGQAEMLELLNICPYWLVVQVGVQVKCHRVLVSLSFSVMCT